MGRLVKNGSMKRFPHNTIRMKISNIGEADFRESIYLLIWETDQCN